MYNPHSYHPMVLSHKPQANPTGSASFSLVSDVLGTRDLSEDKRKLLDKLMFF